MSTSQQPSVTPHPWEAFFYARAQVLRWLRDEMGEAPEVICRTMRMDPGQVRLILDEVDSSPAEFPRWVAGHDGPKDGDR